MTGYKWHPIEDLPDDWQRLASSELAGLFAVWKEQVVRLKDSPAYLEFQARLRREWAIETGIIEGLYDIDRGVTRTLIERGLHASLIAHGDANKPAEEIIPMLKDHEMVVEGLFDFVGQQRQLSTSYIKQIHQALTTHQETATGIDSSGHRTQIPLLRGDWKKWPNNPTREDGSVHEYCPPEQVASEMDQLVEMHQRHLKAGVPPEVEAAWLHHRFTQIHPFQDGNGRVARALASLIFIRTGWFPFVVHRDDRIEYIGCLEKADFGELVDLIELFGRTQKKAFNQALSLSTNVLLDGDPLQRIIEAAADKLKARKGMSDEQKKMFDLSAQLEMHACTYLDINVLSHLRKQLIEVNRNYDAYRERNTPDNAYYFDYEAKFIAKQLNYYADLSTYRAWITLYIRDENWTRIGLSFHSMGESFSGVFSVTPWVQTQLLDIGSHSVEPVKVSEEMFQFSANEELDQLVQRFNKWLDRILITGLDYWRRHL